MKKMTIYERDLRNSTGDCGAIDDDELLRILLVLAALKKKGITINRYNRSDSPNEFVKNEKVNKLLMEEGDDVLPIVDVEGTIVITKRYPSFDEILQLLGTTRVSLGFIEPGSKTSGCCSRKKGCC